MGKAPEMMVARLTRLARRKAQARAYWPHRPAQDGEAAQPESVGEFGHLLGPNEGVAPGLKAGEVQTRPVGRDQPNALLAGGAVGVPQVEAARVAAVVVVHQEAVEGAELSISGARLSFRVITVSIGASLTYFAMVVSNDVERLSWAGKPPQL